jgi:chromosome segregation ATPase
MQDPDGPNEILEEEGSEDQE